MARVDPGDDWPDDTDRQHSLSAALKEVPRWLEEWVAAAPWRSLAPDANLLVVARAHVRQGAATCDTWNRPPGSGQLGLPCIDIFVRGKVSEHVSFHPDVIIERLSAGSESVRAQLLLSQALRAELGLQGAGAIEVSWPLAALRAGNANRFSGLTIDTVLLDLAWLLRAGGVTSARLDELSGRRDSDLQREDDRLQERSRRLRDDFGAALRATSRPGDLGGLAGPLDEAIIDHGLEHFGARIREVARPAIAITTAGPGDKLLVGASRMGGAPDLPPNVAWPSGERGLFSFLIQIDLKRLPTLPHSPLPAHGLLSVFLGSNDHAREVEHRVLYFERGPFRRVAAPAEPKWQDDDTGLLPARALAFQSVINLPAYQSDGFDYLDLYGDNEDGAGSDDYFGLQDHYKPEGADAVSVLLGAGGRTAGEAYFKGVGREDLRVKDRAQLIAELATARIARDPAAVARCERRIADFDWWEERRAEVARGIQDWITLLTLDSHADASMCFWDAGTLEIIIRREDLAAGRFDRTWAAIESG